MSNKTLIILVGRTGDGKSTIGNEILKRLGNNDCPFEEGAGATAHTRASKCIECKNAEHWTAVVDTPGLMDTNGDAQDSQNIKDIVMKARELQHLNMLLLVINARAPRFDAGMQEAIRLIADSFGRDALNHLFIVYSNELGTKSNELISRTDEIRLIINHRCGANLAHLTHYAVENKPENNLYLNAEQLAQIRHKAYEQFDYLLNAADAQERYLTNNVTPASTREEIYQKEIAAANAKAATEKEKKEAAQARAAQLEKEKREAAAAAAVAAAAAAAAQPKTQYISAVYRDQNMSGTLTGCRYITDPHQALTKIGGFYSKSEGVYGSFNGWTRATDDLREGRGGKYIYLYTQREAGEHPIVEIGVNYNSMSVPANTYIAKWLDPWACDGAVFLDTERGVKNSPYLYLWYRVDPSVRV